MTDSSVAAARTSLTIALCGNPNSGKTTVFNALTGSQRKVANYPGVTVERVSGTITGLAGTSPQMTLVDIPGTYSLAAASPDEAIATAAIVGPSDEPTPDAIIAVVDATTLERGLYLVNHLLTVGRPVIVAINMTDLAAERGIDIDTKRLSQELGETPVVALVASRGRGIDELRRELDRLDRETSTSNAVYSESIASQIESLRAIDSDTSRSDAYYARLLFDHDTSAEAAWRKRTGASGAEALEQARGALGRSPELIGRVESDHLAQRSAAIAATVSRTDERTGHSWTARVDRVLLHPVAGPVLLLLIMASTFQAIFAWAEPLMTVIDNGFGALGDFVGGLLPPGPIQSLLVDGVIGGVGSVIIFLPQIIILFVILSVLEASGYLPRAAFLVDRLFSWCGLSGKSLIPLLTSYACAIPGIMATRTIEDRRVRLLTIMVAPLMSCAARLPVYTIMIAAFIPPTTVAGIFNLQGLTLLTLYLLGLVVAVAIAFIVSRLRGETKQSSFLMEIPPYRRPQIGQLARRVAGQARLFLVNAGTVIFAMTVIIWALAYYPQSSDIRQSFAEERESLAVLHDSGKLTETELTSRVEVLDQEEAGALLRDSYFGRVGRALEPVFRPLGWDWKITMAALASFPAREVIIATLGTIYNLGPETDETSTSLVERMRNATWDSGPRLGEPVFSPAVALSIMVFFALCCQCGATVATIRQETGGWGWAGLAFGYMTAMAYVGALVVYQVGSRLGW